jgi:hypothetical protein
MTRFLGLAWLSVVLGACTTASHPPADAGDAGPDLGTPDGGQPDASAPDSIAPDGDEAPADGGGVSCDELSHDPVLGTARLGAAYRVVDSAALPVTSWLPVALVDEALAGGGVGLVAYGHAGDGRVHRLGVWPRLAAPDSTNVAFDAVSPADRTSQVSIMPLLTTTHGQLLAGYRTIRAGAFVGGGVSIFDTARPGAGTRWLAAPRLEGALGLGSYFLVGAAGLGDAAGGLGVYGVYLDEATLHPTLVATYPELNDETVHPGLMAASSNGLVVMGHYLDLASRHSLRLPEPSQISTALSGGPAMNLAAAAELTQASDVANIASFGHGVAVLHTNRVRGVLPALGRLDHYALSRPGGDAGTTVGAPVSVLSASDDGACTIVSQLVPVTGGLTVVVGLWDRNGQRLVRLAPR